MKLRNLHYLSGLVITVFIVLHLFNHLYSVLGSDRHINLMNTLRFFYRNVFAESLLIIAVMIQVFSGLRLFWTRRKTASSFFPRLHIWTGFYLAVFFVFHLAAVFSGRLVLQLDTNFYFGVAGLNTFPFNLFFVPYYALAIISFFGHISAIHHMKAKRTLVGISPGGQSGLILALGIGLTIVIFYGLTNQFNGVSIPEEYGILIGK